MSRYWVGQCVAGVDLIGRDIVGQGSTDVQFCANLSILLVTIEQSSTRGMSLSDQCIYIC
jgi:hypothetical protein